MGERLRLSALWDRVAVILREDIHVLLPVAAAFFFLPSIVLTRFVPSAAIGEFSLPMLVSILLILFFQTIGQLAIFALLLDPTKPTVAQALHLASRRLLPAIGVQFMVFGLICALLVVAQLIAAIFGGAALMRPGGAESASVMRLAVLGTLIASPAILYMLARFLVVFPVLAMDRLTPFEALRRAFRLTEGNGWRIAAFIIVVTVLYLFAQLALGTAFGGVFMLIGRLLGVPVLGSLLTLLFTAALGAIANLIITIAVGILYRDLAD